MVYHVAGRAHIKEKKVNEARYYKVNRDLVLEVAKKAKEAGVKQFVFMSSMSVYGLNHSKLPITRESECHPNTYYGKSKLEAEKLLQELEGIHSKYVLCVRRWYMGKMHRGILTSYLRQ